MTIKNLLNQTSLTIAALYNLYNAIAPHVEYIKSKRLKNINSKKTLQNYVNGDTPTPEPVFRLLVEILTSRVEFEAPKQVYSSKFLKQVGKDFDTSKELIPLAVKNALAKKGYKVKVNNVVTIEKCNPYKITVLGERLKLLVDEDPHISLISLSEITQTPLQEVVEEYKKLVLYGEIEQIVPQPIWGTEKAWKQFMIMRRHKIFSDATTIQEVSKKLKITLSQAGEVYEKAVSLGFVHKQHIQDFKSKAINTLADSYFPRYCELMEDNLHLKTPDIAILLRVPQPRVRRMSRMARVQNLPYVTRYVPPLTKKAQEQIKVSIEKLRKQGLSDLEIYKTLKKQGISYAHTGIVLRKL